MGLSEEEEQAALKRLQTAAETVREFVRQNGVNGAEHLAAVCSLYTQGACYARQRPIADQEQLVGHLHADLLVPLLDENWYEVSIVALRLAYVAQSLAYEKAKVLASASAFEEAKAKAKAKGKGKK